LHLKLAGSATTVTYMTKQHEHSSENLYQWPITTSHSRRMHKYIGNKNQCLAERQNIMYVAKANKTDGNC